MTRAHASPCRTNHPPALLALPVLPRLRRVHASQQLACKMVCPASPLSPSKRVAVLTSSAADEPIGLTVLVACAMDLRLLLRRLRWPLGCWGVSAGGSSVCRPGSPSKCEMPCIGATLWRRSGASPLSCRAPAQGLAAGRGHFVWQESCRYQPFPSSGVVGSAAVHVWVAHAQQQLHAVTRHRAQ